MDKVQTLDKEIQQLKKDFQDLQMSQIKMAGDITSIAKDVKNILVELRDRNALNRKIEQRSHDNQRDIVALQDYTSKISTDIESLKRIVYRWGGAIAVLSFIAPFIISFVTRTV